MFGIGMPELLIILVIVLLIFGAGKLPEIGEGLGRAIRGFRKSMSEPEPPSLPEKDKPSQDDSKGKKST
ncbi:MAG: twin-arginine translocase TatA/TatE family subunit [Nitrospirae bacterium]|nr:twin-arginine translocase TatA/TatE family subunit [Nitrospirota bacterium]